MTYNQLPKAIEKKRKAAAANAIPAGLVMTTKEQAEFVRIRAAIAIDRDYAERCGDIWLRSAPTDKAAERRKAALKNLGLPDTVRFI